MAHQLPVPQTSQCASVESPSGPDDGQLPPCRSRLVRTAKCTGFATVVVAAFLLAVPVSVADEPPQPKYGWRQTWGGVDATRDVWLLYSGITLAPLSPHIHADGLRLRFAGGYGQYRTQDLTGATYKTTHSYGEALVGYQQQFGDLTVKAFGGIAMITHNPLSGHVARQLYGQQTGPKGVLELWLNLGASAWTSLDASYTTAHDTSAVRWRAGWRIMPSLSIGPEVRYDDNSTAKAIGARVGGFARYEWDHGEISVAAGLARPIDNVTEMTSFHNGDHFEPYATVNVLWTY